MSRGHGTIRSHVISNLERGKRYLIAVSGGADSAVLLDACVKVSRLLRLHLEVAHVDHRLRAESSAEADFVKSLAESHQLPFHLKVLGAPPHGANIEAWAREERYAFFAALRASRTLDATLTAHTANDVAETFFMRLLSNKELRTIEAADPGRRVVRPLLNATRSAIMDYARSHKLAYVNDPTNEDVSFLRNRVRHRLLPVLRAEFASGHPELAIELVAHRALATAEDIRTLERIAYDTHAPLERYAWGSRSWLREARKIIAGARGGVRWRIAGQAFKGKLGFLPGRDLSQSLLLLISGRRAAVNLPGGLKARLKNGGISLIKSSS